VEVVFVCTFLINPWQRPVQRDHAAHIWPRTTKAHLNLAPQQIQCGPGVTRQRMATPKPQQQQQQHEVHGHSSRDVEEAPGNTAKAIPNGKLKRARLFASWECGLPDI
jgi:hypothetical protein